MGPTPQNFVPTSLSDTDSGSERRASVASQRVCERVSGGAREGEGTEADVVRQADWEEEGGDEAREDLFGYRGAGGSGFVGRGIVRGIVSTYLPGNPLSFFSLFFF